MLLISLEIQSRLTRNITVNDNNRHEIIILRVNLDYIREKVDTDYWH
jgi:hypothetical protein